MAPYLVQIPDVYTEITEYPWPGVAPPAMAAAVQMCWRDHHHRCAYCRHWYSQTPWLTRPDPGERHYGMGCPWGRSVAAMTLRVSTRGEADDELVPATRYVHRDTMAALTEGRRRDVPARQGPRDMQAVPQRGVHPLS